jgi:hypothetical protein
VSYNECPREKERISLIEMGIIRENISFERGEDPKVSMGLGLKPEIVAMRNELSEMYDMAWEKMDDPYYGGMHEALEQAIQLIDKLSIMKNENS